MANNMQQSLPEPWLRALAMWLKYKEIPRTISEDIAMIQEIRFQTGIRLFALDRKENDL